MVPCADFAFYHSVEARGEMLNSSGWYMKFAIFGNSVCQELGRSIYISETVQVESRQVSLHTLSERAPVSFLIIGVGAPGRWGQLAVQCVPDYEWYVI